MPIGQDRTHIPAPATGASIKGTAIVKASKTSGSLVSIRNPQRAAVIAQIARVHVRVGSLASCVVDVGAPATDVISDNLIDGINLFTTANTIYDNIDDAGANGKTRQYVAANGFFTAYVESGDANGATVDFYFNYQTLEGGSPNR